MTPTLPRILLASLVLAAGTASALARTTRPQRGMSGIVMATTTLNTPVPNTATTASARMISGKAIRMSKMRCRTRSNHPLK